MAENQVYLIKSGQNSFVEETQAIVGISGGKFGIGTTHPQAFFHVTGDTQIGGNLTVDGNFTTRNATTVEIDDKNIVLGSTENPTDASADGGGITLKGSSDKTFNWSGYNNAWTSSENLHLASTKYFAADELRALGTAGLSISDYNGDGIFVEDGGQVGIGTKSPGYELDVVGTGNFSSELYVNGSRVLTASDGDLGKWDDGTDGGDIYYNGGDVGVGTNNPDYKLHVVGGAGVDGNFIVNGTSGNLNVEELNVSGDYVHVNYLSDDLASNRGGLQVHNTNGTGKLDYISSSDHWQFNKKLEVLGDINVQDNLTIGGLISNSASVENNFTVGNNLTVSGNFEVKGTTTTVNTQTVTIEDHNLVIASNTGYNQLTAEYPSVGGGYAGLFWGTGDAGEASPVSLTYQHNKGFNFTGAGVGVGVENPAYDLDVAGTGNFSSAVQAPLMLQNGNTVVDQGDVGSEPNQIPLNKDLGSLAYMDAPQIEDLNVDTLELREIAAEMSETAVDVFVYDTRKDSDGGAWRNRASHTSWYNEELNTATRGGRREFPAVAVIVAEPKRITIYDGDDPDLPMWMVFKEPVYTSPQHRNIMYAPGNITSIYALNGFIITNSQGLGFWSPLISFLRDGCLGLRGGQSSHMIYEGNLAERNVEHDLYWRGPQVDESWWLKDRTVSNYVHDVAMTVLPNAPIDAETGLPIPTIAVATDGGVSVIKGDGSVVDYICTYSSNNKYSLINFIEGSKLLACSRDGETYPTVFDIPSQDKASFDSTDIVFSANPSDSSNAADIRVGNYSEYKASAVTKENIVMGGTSLIISNIDNVSGDQTADNVIISSTYNTGWMPGDIKLATLSDTKIEKVGVDETTELLVDGSGNWVGDFNVAADLDAWELLGDTAGISIVDNKLRIIRSTTLTHATIPVNVIEGKKYVVSGTISGYSGGGAPLIRVSSTRFSGTYIVNDMTGDGDHFRSFTAAYTGVVYVGVGYGTTSGQADFDNISVTETGELITNGTFDDGTTGWTETSDPVLNVTNNKLNLKCLSGDSQAGIHQNFLADDTSRKYILSFDIDSFVGDTAANLVVGVDDYWNNSNLGGTQLFSGKENGSYSFAFDGRSGGMSVLFRIYDTTGTCSEDTSINISNISVRLAEPDRSVNDNGLQIFGAIDKTPVAPGADLVAYSGFSADNYLVQPYNADLDFGTGDFLSTWWIYRNDTLAGSVFHRSSALVTGNTATSDAILQAEFGASQFQAQVYTNGFGLPSDNSTLTYTGVPSGVWTHMAMSRKSNVLSLYVNGKFIDSVQSDATVTNTNAPMSIGTRAIRSGLERPLNGSLALLRFSATAPTPDQIAKIYRDEKALFTDGAQATLYGTSDAVTALAYDDSDDLLHVGTASGRSVFNGLKRVDNTDVAVTTAISATEGLVIEQ